MRRLASVAWQVILEVCVYSHLLYMEIISYPCLEQNRHLPKNSGPSYLWTQQPKEKTQLT